MSPYEMYTLHSIQPLMVHLIMVGPNLLGHCLATKCSNDSRTWNQCFLPYLLQQLLHVPVHGHTQVALLICGSHAFKKLTTNRRPFVYYYCHVLHKNSHCTHQCWTNRCLHGINNEHQQLLIPKNLNPWVPKLYRLSNTDI